ncbi:tRNA pseudouridine synthase D [Loa loa]|uniref:tRNA pseudouridine synthase D n=1 Tax=Loa loa TaxID=7209 RepID=A0A1S0U0Q0_LOALO|nr:tRNA pseudouridine synthase D [Loa loa]EFO22545.2 tRNA pseudouridine synthase D [Loa loa]
MEGDFFITEYMSCGRDELKCTIKKLYSDFIVNEITSDGTVLDICLPCTTETIIESKEIENSLTDISVISTPEAVTQELVSKIDGLLKDEISVVEIPTEGMDKQKRTIIHDWIRNRYNGLLDSQTVTSAIRVLISNKRTRKRRTWPVDRPDYVHFTLCKENKDTHYALSVISKFLGIKNTSFGICGTKDRRALTTQRVSLYRCEIQRLRELNAKLRGIRLTDFTSNSKPCKLGDLWGNRFKIILRDVHPFSETDLVDRIEDFKSNGFINYFGTQRFGSCAFNTAEIGIAILKKEWEVALKTILKPRNAHGSIREALDEWNKSGNASTALKKLTGSQAYATIEGQLLSSLSRNKCDYHGALLKLTRNTRSLYVHAYQSLLWNKVVTRWVKNRGFRAVAGDLNVQGQKISDFQNEEVALPLISGSVEFPDNEVRDWYKEIMAEDGVTIAMFKALEKEWAIGTVMRPLIAKAQDVKYKILTYPEARTKLQADLEGDIDSGNIGVGDFHAVALEFSLPSGSYATIALREITRCDMSKLAQMSVAQNEKDLTESV